MRELIERAALWMHQVGAALTIAVTLVICYDVAGRLLFNRPFYGGAELAATGLVLIVFLQVPYSILQKKLLRVTFFYELAGRLGRSALNSMAYAVGAVFFAALFATSWEPLVESLRTAEFYGMDAFRIPAWPLRIATLLLWLLTSLACVYLMLQSLRGRMTEAEDHIPD
jgi:TRAP-type C4-dicarboxylate transport system permease small subunit